MSSSVITAPRVYSSFTVKNSNNQIGKIKFKSDFSVSNQDKTLQRTIADIESISVATTLDQSKAQEIENLLSDREPLLNERNKILGSPIKALFPSYKKRLREIDAKLDKLDLHLYLLETEETIKDSDLDEIVSTAEARLKKYSKYLQSK